MELKEATGLVVDVMPEAVVVEGAVSKPAYGKQLHFISGLRFFATLWIVVGHCRNNPSQWKGEPLLRAVRRGYAPVYFYVFLSGFITTYSYGRKSCWSDPEARVAFWRRRFRRCAPAYLVSWLLATLLTCALHLDKTCVLRRHSCRWDAWLLGVVSSAFGVQAWLVALPPPWRYAALWPSPPAWTMSTLGFCWFVHPWLETALTRRAPTTKRALTLAAASAAVGALPSVGAWYLLGTENVSAGVTQILYAFPLCMLDVYARGILFAIAYRRALDEAAPAPGARRGGLLVAGGALALAVLVLAFPSNGKNSGRKGDEVLLFRAVDAAQAVVFWGLLVAPSEAAGPTFLAHAAFRDLGGVSYQVYLFQIFFILPVALNRGANFPFVALVLALLWRFAFFFRGREAAIWRVALSRWCGSYD